VKTLIIKKINDLWVCSIDDLWECGLTLEEAIGRCIISSQDKLNLEIKFNFKSKLTVSEKNALTLI